MLYLEASLSTISSNIGLYSDIFVAAISLVPHGVDVVIGIGD